MQKDKLIHAPKAKMKGLAEGLISPLALTDSVDARTFRQHSVFRRVDSCSVVSIKSSCPVIPWLSPESWTELLDKVQLTRLKLRLK